MTVKVFLTGVTGYIGGSVFDHVYNKHKDWEYVLLLRNEARGRVVKEKYPAAKQLYAALDDEDAISKAAAEADIVIDTADSADHAPAARAIAKGLKEGHNASRPGYWIHLSGTGILTWYDQIHNRGGEAPIPAETYHDVDGVDRLVTLPDEAHHRDVDKLVQESISDVVRVAILAPCTIYGVGSGPVNTRSIQVPKLAQVALQDGFAPIIGAGKTEWDNVHIEDLVDLYLKLVDATQDPEKNGNKEIFGPNAYFFASNGVHLWSDLARQIVGEIKKQGYKSDVVTKSITLEELKAVKEGTNSWGLNSKGVPQRAKKYLGWQPKAVALEDTIPELVRLEAKALGL